MIDSKAQDLLRHKVRGKLSTHWPSVPRKIIEAVTEQAILDVRENDDWLFDMMVDVAIASAKDHLRGAILHGDA